MNKKISKILLILFILNINTYPNISAANVKKVNTTTNKRIKKPEKIPMQIGIKHILLGLGCLGASVLLALKLWNFMNPDKFYKNIKNSSGSILDFQPEVQPYDCTNDRVSITVHTVYDGASLFHTHRFDVNSQTTTINQIRALAIELFEQDFGTKVFLDTNNNFRDNIKFKAVSSPETKGNENIDPNENSTVKAFLDRNKTLTFVIKKELYSISPPTTCFPSNKNVKVKIKQIYHKAGPKSDKKEETITTTTFNTIRPDAIPYEGLKIVNEEIFGNLSVFNIEQLLQKETSMLTYILKTKDKDKQRKSAVILSLPVNNEDNANIKNKQEEQQADLEEIMKSDNLQLTIKITKNK
ncbi:MAG: hypothetical protein NkDv07_0938 [Candidatus Improbicoccus devescovinae]|nr:MAG: hypothetical protein NkDv07_0938 [Candidatus Improbicoccus devescovinae]